MIMRKECEGCEHYKVLAPRIIIDGQQYKSCDLGEHPGYCQEAKHEVHSKKES